MSSAAIVSNLQNINPSSVIELFTLALDNSLHGATTVYRFHAGKQKALHFKKDNYQGPH